MATFSKYYKKEITDALVTEGTANKLKLALFTTTHPYANAATQEHYADIIANECSGAGYTEGGKLLTSVACVNIGNNARLTADNVSWTTVTVSAMYAVLYNTDTGHIRAQYSLGVERNVTAGTLLLTWHASGVLEVL
jgi:hypothetical protein